MDDSTKKKEISEDLLATIVYVLAANEVAKAYNLQYAPWALGIGMIISNTIGTPGWLFCLALTFAV